MIKVLVVDDDPVICGIWVKYLRNLGYTTVTANDVNTACDLFDEAVESDEEFDLIVLDHELGRGETGLTFLSEIDESKIQYKVVVVTGHPSSSIARDYARAGAVSHLIKPVSESQFTAGIEAALERQSIYVDQLEDWNHACELLERHGILDSISNLQSDFQSQTQELYALRGIHQKLLEDLKAAGGKESSIADAYSRASDAVNKTDGSFEGIYSYLRCFKVTTHFLNDLHTFFKDNRIQFYVLQSYLERIALSPNEYRVRNLNGGATGHYEYRIGKNYRLYFRREAGEIVLERFGHKNIQGDIITFLDRNQGEIADLNRACLS